MSVNNDAMAFLNDAAAIQAIAGLAQDAAGAVDEHALRMESPPHGLPASVPIVIRGGKAPAFESVKKLFEEWRTAPDRRRGTAKVATRASFIDLVCRHKTADSVLFASTLWPSPHIMAIVNYHKIGGDADNADHRIRYEFPLTEEFKLWCEKEANPMGQAEFAHFIEDNIADLSVALESEVAKFEDLFKTKFAIPTDMIALSRGLRVNVEEKVSGHFMTQSGEAEIKFSTEHKGSDGQALIVPGLFMLSLPVFLDGQDVRIPARLRYRIKDGQVVWTYHLYKWRDALRERVVADLAIAQQQTGLPAYEGAPETA